MNYKIYKVGSDECEYIAATSKSEALDEHLSRVDVDTYEENEEIEISEIDIDSIGWFEKDSGGYEELTWRQWLNDFKYNKPTLLCWNE